MINCGNCGAENEAEALFCGTCGKPLIAGSSKPTPPDGPDGTGVITDPDDGDGDGDGSDDQGQDPPDDVKDPDDGSTITCPHCGTVNPVARNFCSFCAKKLRPDVEKPKDDEVIPLPPPWKAIAVGVVAVVAALAVIVIAVAGGGPRATVAPSSSTVVPTSATTAVATPLVTPSASPTLTEGAPSGQIAFARCTAGTNSTCRIALIKPDGTGFEALTSGSSATDPAFSSDGKRLVYSLSSGLQIMTLATRKVAPQSSEDGDTNGAWAPDDQMITFSGSRPTDTGPNNDLEIRIDGIGPGPTSQPLTTNDIQDHDPVWVPPAGTFIIWVAGREDERDLMMIDVQSRTVTALTDDSFNDVDPAVSPDGSQLVFASKRGSTDDTFDLWIMDLRDLTNLVPRRLAEIPGSEHDPAWSPGGRYIVFSGDKTGAEDLFILDVQGGGVPKQITSSGDLDKTPTWH